MSAASDRGLVLQLRYCQHRSQGRPAERKGRAAVHDALTARQAVLGTVRQNEFWLVYFKLINFGLWGDVPVLAWQGLELLECLG
jgi:hypothetical protein